MENTRNTNFMDNGKYAYEGNRRDMAKMTSLKEQRQ